MLSDSHLFRSRDQLEEQGYVPDGNLYRKPGAEDYVPLYEAKMIHHFDHRWVTYEGERTRDLTVAEKENPEGVVRGRVTGSATAMCRPCWTRRAGSAVG